MMRRIGLIILAWLCVLLVSAQSDTIRVLAIGNSSRWRKELLGKRFTSGRAGGANPSHEAS